MAKTESGENRGPELNRPKHEIVAEAKAGRPGKLTVPFLSADPKTRREEIARVLDSHTLDGLTLKILLNPADAAALPLAVTERSDVPAGEFHVELTRAH